MNKRLIFAVAAQYKAARDEHNAAHEARDKAEDAAARARARLSNAALALHGAEAELLKVSAE